MALTKVTGQVIKNTTDVTVGVLTVTNPLAVGGTVSIGGTLTYEDVTNVDAVGLVTARNGIVVGSGITLSKDGDIFATGVTTTGSLVSSGAISGTTGTFSGAVSGTTGTFSSAVSGTTGTFSGAVSGTTGTFSSTGSFTGNVNIGANSSSNPFTYLRFGASQYGAADIRPKNESSHKVGLEFYTDGTQDSTINPTLALTIGSDGNVTKPRSSRFATHIAYTSGNEAAHSKIAMAAAHVNIGSDFSDSNDRFTAPVDGDYAFWFHTNVAKSGSGAYYATWYKNGSEVNSTAAGRMYDQHSGSGWHNLSGCIMLNLSEGDYVEVYNGSVVVNYDGNSYGQWMGWLVG